MMKIYTTYSILTLLLRFHFFAHVLLLGQKGPPRRLLRKTRNLFLPNCDLWRIDHGDFNDSNFEVD